MEKSVVTNLNSTIEVQNNAGRDINIHNHHSPTSPELTSGPIKFHFSEPTKTFAGRHKELQQLSEWFFDQKRELVVICGCPGYGKTELGRQFIRQSKQDNKISNILWMEAETPDKLMQSFRDLAKLLRLPELDDHSLVEKVYEHFKGSSCIIVFDNAMCRRDIAQLEPRGRCMCLVTSHVKDWGDDVESLPLVPLSVSEALDALRAVLQHRFNAEHTQLYEELVEVVSCVPLALQIAAAYLRQEIDELEDEFNLCDHLLHLKQSYEEIVDKPIPDSSSNTYDKSVSQAIHVSLCKLNNINNDFSKLAVNILHTCAYLYPEQIPYSDLLKLSHLKKLLENSVKPDKNFKKACSLLCKYFFISDVDKKISIHRLVQHTLIFLQKYLVTENNNDFYSSCLELLLIDINSSHRDFILQYAEKNIGTFLNFYSQYKSDIISTYPFLHNITVAGIESYLKVIFDGLGDDAANVINTLLLLHTAVKYRKHGVAELLIKYGADVTDSENTILHLAAIILDLRSVQILTFHKADVDKKYAADFSVMHLTVFTLNEPMNLGRSEEACKILRCLADQGASTKPVDQFQRTLLHAAAMVLSVDLIHFLVREFGQSVEAVDVYEQTPLHLVSIYSARDVKEERLKTAECLLKYGARLDVENKRGLTPAQYARQQGHECLAIYLENPSRGYDITQISESVFDVLRSLVVEGKISDLKEKLNEFDKPAAEINNHCLLHEAVFSSQYEVLEVLLEYGADIDRTNNANRTALYVATNNCDFHSIQILMSRGADVNINYNENLSFLYSYIWMSANQYYQKQYVKDEEYEILRKLIERTNVVNWGGLPLLHFTASIMHTGYIDYMVCELHHDVNAVDEYEQTPLYNVIYGLQNPLLHEAQGINTAECLVKHGARLDIVNVEGLTPAQVARAEGFEDLANYLEDTEARQIAETSKLLRTLVTNGDSTGLIQKLDEFDKPATENINNNFLLHEAVNSQQYDMLKLLLECGAEINSRNNANLTALYVATEKLDLHAMQLLISRGADVNISGADSWLVLHAFISMSAIRQHTRHYVEDEEYEMLRILIERTDDINLEDMTLLHFTAGAMHTDFIDFLVRELHHDVHAMDECGQTPLFYIIDGLQGRMVLEEQGIRTAKCLVRHGARCNVVNVEGLTPAQHAHNNRFKHLATYLENPAARQESPAGEVAGQWGWSSTYVGVACAAVAAAAMQIYRNA